MAKTTINRQIKDRLFVWLFGREENKANILELYNALNNTHYTDPDALEINTIENIVYMGMRNDVSFLLEGIMLNLWEQQSTYNPNMPIRGLLYLAQLYNNYIETHNLNLYGETRFQLPAPQFVVFYLGDRDEPDRQVLKLSDSFPQIGNPDFVPCVEVSAIMLNVNAGHNEHLLKACRMLGEYSALVQKIREYAGEMTVKEATERAVNYCIENNILRDVLMNNKSEVIGMLLTEYDEKKTQDLFREEYLKQGRSEGLREGERRGHSAGLREGERKGRAVGRSEGEDRFASLVNALVSAGRMDDVKKASTDDVYRQKLYKEFKL